MTLLQMKEVREVTVTYEDGTHESFVIPEHQGFYRETFTYKQNHDFKVEAVLDIHEIFWTITREANTKLFELTGKNNVNDT